MAKLRGERILAYRPKRFNMHQRLPALLWNIVGSYCNNLRAFIQRIIESLQLSHFHLKHVERPFQIDGRPERNPTSTGALAISRVQKVLEACQQSAVPSFCEFTSMESIH